MRDLYELLGVDADASKEEIEEAYRLRVVGTHRRGVFALSDRFKEFQSAYEVLTDAERRQKYDSARELLVLKGKAASDKSRRDAVQRVRREGRIRKRYARKVGLDSFRVGNAAVLENAPKLEALSDEHDRIEAAERRARRRREILSRIARAVVFGALLAGAVLLWLRK